MVCVGGRGSGWCVAWPLHIAKGCQWLSRPALDVKK